MPRVRGARGWRAVLVGATAALGSPLSLGGARLAALLRPSNIGDASATSEEVALALGVAGRALIALDASLRWLPPRLRPWRNSCLYRSAAQCAVLRRYGRAAHVALGAGRVSRDDVGAHAWVVYDGPESVERPAADFVSFRPSAPAPR